LNRRRRLFQGSRHVAPAKFELETSGIERPVVDQPSAMAPELFPTQASCGPSFWDHVWGLKRAFRALGRRDQFASELTTGWTTGWSQADDTL
jgi:hypothetical protein